MLRGVYEMLRLGWLPHQSSHAIDDVSTHVFHRALVNVIPTHIMGSELYPLPESLIICCAGHEFLHTIPILEAWEMQSNVFFLQHIVIVCLHTLLLDLTVNIFVLFTRCKQVVGIVL